MLHFARAAFLLIFIAEFAEIASVGHKVGISAVEKYKLSQRAFEIAVKERYLHGRFKPDIGEILVVEADNPCLPALEVLFEGCPDSFIKSCHIFRTDSLTVRRIHDKNACFRIIGPFAEGTARKIDHILHFCLLDVFTGNCHCFRVDIAAKNLECEFLFGAVVVVYLFEEFLVEIGPFFESEA